MTFRYEPSELPEEYSGHLKAMWQFQQMRYEQMWRLYTGAAWQEVDPAKPNAPRKYRLAVNDIALACLMHAQLLFGEVRDNSDPLLSGKVEARKGQTVRDDDIQRAQDFLDELWGESSSRKNQFLAALSSQVTGGVFWRVRYALDDASPFDLYPLKFEPVHADYVFPVFATGANRLSEVFVRYKLPREAARTEWGVWSGDWPEEVEYREHWTGPLGAMPGTLSIRVGVQGTWRTVKVERNPFGFVPFVYIPHMPSNGFFGIPLPEMAMDMAVEYNERLADAGDIMKQNAFPFAILKNHPTGKLKSPFRLWRDGLLVVDLGKGIPGEDAPEMDFFDPSELNNSYIEYLGTLKQEMRLAMSIPPVAMGEDEGSQRSSLTLLARMFPVKSHVTAERWLWGAGFTELNRMALVMAQVKQVGNLDRLDVRKVTVTPNWSPMLPRDRQELVSELVQRQAAGHIDPVKAIEQYGDYAGGEIEEAYAAIRQHMEWQAELTPHASDAMPVERSER